jgi:hypothetical protein
MEHFKHIYTEYVVIVVIYTDSKFDPECELIVHEEGNSLCLRKVRVSRNTVW